MQITGGVETLTITAAEPGAHLRITDAAGTYVATVVADAISLTPGTLTLDVRARPPMLDVHVMGPMRPDEVEADLRSLEALVLAALEPVGREGSS